MARSIPRSPLFHKGLTVFTAKGTALPLAGPSKDGLIAPEPENSDNKVLQAHHVVRDATEKYR